MIRIFTTLFFLIITFQTYSQACVGIGIKSGLNFASFKTTYQDGDIVIKPGITGGLYGLVKMKKLGIQTEVMFSQQGTYYRPSVDQNFDLTQYQFDFVYINIPVIAKYYLYKSFHIQAGPQIGLLMNAEGYDLQDKSGGTVKDKYDAIDLAFCSGLGWDWRFGLSIELRYMLGLSDIQNDPSIPSTKNRVGQFTLGYRFIKFGKG